MASRYRQAAVVIVGIVALGAALGCSKDATPTAGHEGTTAASGTTLPAGSPLTAAQAQVLSQALFTNYDTGGATIDVTVPYGPAATFRLTGDVDWKEHRGKAQLVTTYADNRAPTTTALVWTPALVLVTDASGAATMHALDAKQSGLDRVLAFLDSLSSDRPENAQLLQQGEARFVKHDQVDGVDVDVFRAGDRTTYVLRSDTGQLVRVDAEFKGFAGPVAVVVKDPGRRSIELPVAFSEAPGSTPGTTAG